MWESAFASARSEFDYLSILYALLAAVVVLFLMRRAGFLRRTEKWHQTLVCVYYVYIPLVFVGAATAWSTLYAAQSGVQSAFEQSRPAIAEASAKYADSAWKSIVAVFRANPTITVKELIFTVAQDYSEKLVGDFYDISKITAFTEPLVSSFRSGIASSLITYLEAELIDSAAGVARLDKELVQRLWESDLDSLLKGGIVCDIVKQQVPVGFSPLFGYVRMTTILLLLPVIFETAFSVYRRRRLRA